MTLLHLWLQPWLSPSCTIDLGFKYKAISWNSLSGTCWPPLLYSNPGVKSTTTQLHSKKTCWTIEIRNPAFSSKTDWKFGEFSNLPKKNPGGQMFTEANWVKSEWFFAMGHKLKQNSITNDIMSSNQHWYIATILSVIHCLSCGSFFYTLPTLPHATPSVTNAQLSASKTRLPSNRVPLSSCETKPLEHQEIMHNSVLNSCWGFPK